MTTLLIKKGYNYYCLNCMMRSNLESPYCQFCNAFHSNWEDVVNTLFIEKNQEEIKDTLQELDF